MTYTEAIRFLYGLRAFGLKLGLETTLELASGVDHPERRLRFVHVAGTNGKGSTCAMIEAIYRGSGLRTGLFTSPHLVSFRERIEVNRQSISETDLCRRVMLLRPLVESFPPEERPTVFEVVTLIGLLHFAEQQCDIVIWETGMGGRLDATNIVVPMASIITNIGLDHEKWLGSTLPEIAREKAGIIKPGVPVITACDDPGALQVIRETASARSCPIHIVTHESAMNDLRALQPPGAQTTPPALSLAGSHQILNAGVALKTVRVLEHTLPCTSNAKREGLATARWPGRFQIIHPEGTERTLILDGAHNAAGARALAQSLGDLFPGRSPTLILGMLADKDTAAMCGILAPLAGRILLAPVQSARGLAPEAMMAPCAAVNPSAPIATCRGLGEALKRCATDPFVVVAGSLYLIGEAIETLGLCEPGVGERELNEWMPTHQQHENTTQRVRIP